MATKFTIVQADSLGKTINENFKTNITMSEIVDTSTGKAALIDSFGRKISALTTNTFNDVTVTETNSITEILAE